MIRFYYLTILLSFITSCTIQKRLHQPGYHVEWHKKEKNQVNIAEVKHKIKPSNEISTLHDSNSELLSKADKNIQTTDWVSSSDYFSKDLYNTTHIPILTTNNSKEKCDTIIMKNGERMIVKVKTATSELISFQKCGDSEKMMFKMDATDVLIIKYANETAEVLGSKREIQKMNVSYKKTEVFSVLSLSLSLVAIFIILFLSMLGGGILSLVALIFGIVGLSRVSKNNDKYKGKGMAAVGVFFSIAGIIMSIIFINMTLLVLGL